ncbi:MAG: hypothetical protein RL385_1443 [Pseudomonadota bacterium]|jgi:hypothetical protein
MNKTGAVVDRTRRQHLLLAAPLLAGVLTGGAAHICDTAAQAPGIDTSSTPTTSIKRTPRDNEEDVDVVLDFGLVSYRGGQVKAEVLRRSNLARRALTSVHYVLTDDRGNAIGKAAQAALKTVEANGLSSPDLLTLSATLKDGLYQVRIFVAADDGENNVGQEYERYLRVKGGVGSEITAAEWFQLSNANEGSNK